MELKEIIKGENAKLEYICNGSAQYIIDNKWQLPIDLNNPEWKDVYIAIEYKPITLMRWIRKAIDNGTLISLVNENN